MNWFQPNEELIQLLAEYKDMIAILKDDKKDAQAMVVMLKQHQSQMSQVMYQNERKLLSLTHLVGDITETLLTINGTYKEKDIDPEPQIMDLVKFASQQATGIVKNGNEYAKQRIEQVVKETKKEK